MVLLAAAATIAAAIAWGSLTPPREPDVVEEDDAGGHGETGATGLEAVLPMDEAVAHPSPEPVREDRRPGWVKGTIGWTVALVVAVAVGLGLIGVLHEVVLYLLLALFFSFALEPAVNYMHSSWGWKRGSATGLLLVAVFLLLTLLVLIFIPALLKGAATVTERLPKAAADLPRWASDHLGIDVSTSSIQDGARDATSSLESAANTPMSVLLGFTASLVGGLFALFTVGMFIFYMVADAPRFKRAVLSLLPRKQQQELLSIWEAAIEKTGGYFYGKLVLAGINGGLFYVVLRVAGVPGAAALAFFQGVVAAFIPIVGTYIAAVVPLIIAFITVGWEGTLVVLIYILIYQQVENYLISPRIQGKTMQLHPAIAFAAAMAGGAIGGLLWAFLALPFAATVQASASLWIEHHEVVDSELTRVEPVVLPQDAARAEEESVLERGEGLARSTRGWIRRWL